MNRIVLQVELKEQTKVKFTLIFLDKRFLSIGKSFIYYANSNEDFMILSKNDNLVVDDTVGGFCLTFPNLEKYRSNISIVHSFKSEVIRKNYLKKLSECIQEWSENFTPFVNGYDYDLRLKKLKFHDKYWLI
jgi:hypothetical protein